MSCQENDKIREALWERFADLWDQGNADHAASMGEDACILNMLGKIEGTCDEEYICLNKLEDLFDRLWKEDAEYFSRDMEGFLTRKLAETFKK